MSLDMSREEMINKLNVDKCVVLFTRVDGTLRSLLCTLDKNIIPSTAFSYSSGSAVTKKINDEVIKVWSINDEGWRSFRINSVIKFLKHQN